jgi:hexosaminidase
MKLIIRYFIFFLLLSPKIFATNVDEFNQHFKLLPQPQKIELLNEKGLYYTDLRDVYLKNTNQKPVMTGLLENLPLSGIQKEGTLSLILSHDLGLPSPEGYTLEIKDKQVIIQAEQEAGLFYGIQTLIQLLEDSHDQKIEIPACRIVDYPEIAYRAIHLDLKHHIDAGHYYSQMIDRLANIKINAIIIEFEDKLRYRQAPLVGAANAITIEEFAAISRYAKERNIEISPLIQGLGHASFILKHEEYKKLRDDPASDWVFDPLNPETYKLQFALYEDAIAATPYGKYLHIGGDEVGTLGKSELCKKSGKNPFELQMYWLKKVTEFANEHNRIPIFWDDMVFKLSGLYKTTYDPEITEQNVRDLWTKNMPMLEKSIPLFPQNCVYMRWNYDYPKLPGNLNAIDWYKEHGLNMMAATSAQCMTAMMPRNNSNFQAIKDFCQLTSEKRMNGILCTIWDDCSPHFETVWRGLYDFALFSWNYEDISPETANALFRHRFYSPELEPASFEFQNLLEKALAFWDVALISEGDRENYHKTFKLIDLPDANKKGIWAMKYKEKIGLAGDAVSQYRLINTRIEKALELSRRNTYSVEVFKQINELQVYPSNLLLLLQQYDNAPAQNKKEISLRIKKFVNDFGALRVRLETVFSETRILGNPEEYQLDSNFHQHLANGTNNTDWMYMYELVMNQKIMEWLSAQGID